MARLLRLPVGPAVFDAASALEAWLAFAGSDQGFAIEKDAGAEIFVGAAPDEVLRVRGGKAYRGAKALPGNPFAALGRAIAARRVAGAKAFDTAAVGSLSYEMVRHLERVPLAAAREEAFLMLFPAVLRGGTAAARAELCAQVSSPREERAARALAAKLASVLEPPRAVAAPNGALAPLKGLRGKAAFTSGVRRLKDHIGAGDIFQAVLSESFTAPLRHSPPALFRRLRALGPSPYLYALRDGKRWQLGASPERLVRVVEGRALNCPIAGTRPRGATPARDKELERQLVRSPKERAEHLMLVDLARNDLGRVCAPGSVRVADLMKVKRYPNVMHLVSEVEGRLDRGLSAWDALMASFPAGTVSGAPKVRAMELVGSLERGARGFYAGAVVQHDFSGNLDSCIAIRSAWVEGGAARIQAGAGVVADSRPEAEYQEVLNKLSSLRRALA